MEASASAGNARNIGNSKGSGGLDRNLYSDNEWEDLSLLLRGEEEFYKRKEKLFLTVRNGWKH